ncbi:MAG: PH domain-containing protein [Actinomycetota bacterium]|nr:PH domain-containing protein [Actinomycetota bacterium]
MSHGDVPAGDAGRESVGGEPAPRRPTPEPTRRLAENARPLWTTQALVRAVPVLLGAWWVAHVLGEIDGVPAVTGPAVAAIAIVMVVADIFVLPRLRYRLWRYEVREQEIDLVRGAFTVRRTLVPMNRIQHVDTKRTVLSEAFGLASVVFHTAAGDNEIPALTEEQAAEIRDRIADLAFADAEPV